MDQIGKKATRSDLRDLLAGISEQEYRRKSARACDNLQKLEEFQDSAVVMMFLSITREILTTTAISAALKQGKTVVVPKVNWHNHSIIPVSLTSLDMEMESDRYGLRHPVRAEQIAADSIDLIVLPGIGFDRQGNRLGRGGGFYDRFLNSNNGCSWSTCGLAFEEQIIPQVPIENHDIAVNMLVTDTAIRKL